MLSFLLLLMTLHAERSAHFVASIHRFSTFVLKDDYKTISLADCIFEACIAKMHIAHNITAAM
jgi:hypothetical protein